jgi:hypothetical protein
MYSVQGVPKTYFLFQKVTGSSIFAKLLVRKAHGSKKKNLKPCFAFLRIVLVIDLKFSDKTIQIKQFQVYKLKKVLENMTQPCQNH